MGYQRHPLQSPFGFTARPVNSSTAIGIFGARARTAAVGLSAFGGSPFSHCVSHSLQGQCVRPGKGISTPGIKRQTITLSLGCSIRCGQCMSDLYES